MTTDASPVTLHAPLTPLGIISSIDRELAANTLPAPSSGDRDEHAAHLGADVMRRSIAADIARRAGVALDLANTLPALEGGSAADRCRRDGTAVAYRAVAHDLTDLARYLEGVEWG